MIGPEKPPTGPKTSRDSIRAYYYVLREMRILAQYYQVSLEGDGFLKQEFGEHWGVVRDAVREGLLFHLRNLNEFFARPSSDSDHIVSEDYGFPRKSILNPEIIRKLHNEIAHLSYDRLNREGTPEEGWMIFHFIPDVLTNCKEFMARMLPTIQKVGNREIYERRTDWGTTEELIGLIDEIFVQMKKMDEEERTRHRS